MQPNKRDVLTGAHNKRLNNVDPTHNQITAPVANEEKVLSESHVNVPSEQSVMNAKEWVDNGSRL